MPLYEYACQACGSTLELMQKISDPVPESCPKCQQGPLTKLVSRTGFILKGEGWYVTDFRDKTKKPVEKSSEASTSGAEAAPAKDSAPSQGAGASGTSSAAPSVESSKSSPSKSDA